MRTRLDLSNALRAILGSSNVYFQSPSNVQMKYPAIRYSLNNIDSTKAEDSLYLTTTSYTLTLIDKDPESVFVGPLLELPKCKFDRWYASDGLNHFVFTIYL